MSKIKYRFNTHSLTFEKVGFSWKKIALKVLSYLAIGTVFTAITVFIANFLAELQRLMIVLLGCFRCNSFILFPNIEQKDYLICILFCSF